ncbi:hypothetical protein SAY87_001034 [Trapa incisa]|uniref:UDP-MurNAc-pentapeptide synthetase n=1 Tax=Trapa incisa TaxID=236973 RepID=A0AAN7JHJ4_9MYRT|nr:hypothetical protein SAY87_001034 [Trapa incisa]
MNEMSAVVWNPIPANTFHSRISASSNPTLKIASNASSTASLALWTASEIAEAVGGRIVKWGPPGTVSSDTRTLRPGQWFFAIAGKKFDAHDFVNPQLRDKGCVGVIGNKVCHGWDGGFVQVGGDSVGSLTRMGSYARGRFFGPVIGVTGSVGKTTTKTMIALILEGSNHKVYQSPGNWNNQIGVGLSLIGLPRDGGIAVLEMGMSGKGEILELARMARPLIRMILNVGPSHLENFYSLKEVANAKGEIFEEAVQGDTCILNADDPLVAGIHIPNGVRKVMFGQKQGSDVRLVAAEVIDKGLSIRVVLEDTIEMVEFVIPNPGVHLALNACAAAAAVSLLGVSLSQVGLSLSRFTPIKQRSVLEVTKNGIKLVNDVYNANPDSTKAAIDLLTGIKCDGKRVAILADMLELGKSGHEYHEMILKYCFDRSIDLVGLVGSHFGRVSKDWPWRKRSNIICACDADSMAIKIVGMLNGKDVVLVKGSRKMKMEIVVEAIRAKEK